MAWIGYVAQNQNTIKRVVKNWPKLFKRWLNLSTYREPLGLQKCNIMFLSTVHWLFEPQCTSDI